MKSATVKKEFGLLFMQARRRAGLSRRDLSLKIGISQTTIKNWEAGRTFVEDLGLVDILERDMNFYIPAMLDVAVKNIRSRRS